MTWRSAGLIIIAAVLIAGYVVFHEDEASNIMRTCAGASYVPACYDAEIPKLMDQGYTMEDAFEVARTIQERSDDEQFMYCHVLGHRLAEKEAAKDPSKWAQVAARCPVGMCASGCLHGAMQERFKRETLTPDELAGSAADLAGACAPTLARSYTELELAFCSHFLGHLTTYASGADLTLALDTCDLIEGEMEKLGSADPETTMRCYEGAFMQVFQPLDPEDEALVKDLPVGDTQSADRFCASFSGARADACHRESWPLSKEEVMNAGGIESFCAINPDPRALQDCYNLVLNMVAILYAYDVEDVAQVCDGFGDARRAQCFARTASQAVSTDYRLTDTAMRICAEAQARGIGKRCYDELLVQSVYAFKEGTPEFSAFCRAFPSEYREACQKGAGNDVPRYILDI